MDPITREELFLAKAAGQEVETPTPITRVEMFLKNLIDHISQIGAGGGTGGGTAVAQSDWNANEGEPGHILNRTHWAENKTIEIYPETGFTLVDMDGMNGMEIDLPISSLVAGNVYTVSYNGSLYETTATDLSGVGDTLALGDISWFGVGESTGEPFVILAMLDDGVEHAILGSLDGATSVFLSITTTGEIVHKLEDKYLDSEWMASVGEEEETVYDVSLTGSLLESNGCRRFTFSNHISTELTENKRYKVNWCGTEYSCVARVSDDLWQGSVYLGNKSIKWESALDTGEPFVIFDRAEQPDICYSNDGNLEPTCKITFLKKIPNKMPEEYLPESMDGVILRSSTEGSTKKFKLTVDDSGTITATEVT